MKHLNSAAHKIKVLLLSEAELIVEGWRNALSSAADIELLNPPKHLTWNKPPKASASADIILLEAAVLQNEDARRWLTDIRTRHQTKIIAVVSGKRAAKKVRALGADEAIFSPFRSQQLLGLIRGVDRDDKSLCMAYARQLEQLAADPAGAEEYIDLVASILQMVFAPLLTDLQITRLATERGKLAYLTFENRSMHHFWSRIREEHGSHTIVFSIHNEPSYFSQQARKLDRYLTPAMGRFAFLCNRREPNSVARTLQFASHRNGGKSILVLFDPQIRMLLALKAAGAEPSEYIEDLYQELFIAMSDPEK